MIPAWLLAKNAGHLRHAALRTCRCGAPVLAGLDAERAALTAKVDLTPIDEMGEILALLQGRPTYDLTGGNQKRELEFRYEWNIKTPRRYPVLVAHKCGMPIPAAAPTEVPDKTPPADNDTPPF